MTGITRLEALEEYEVLDTIPENEFDDIVELASAICDTPISLISLLDKSRQWFKARKGLGVSETKIEYAFCQYAIQNPNEVMVVNDSLQDKRFKTNPLVTGDPNIRFYAGAPLITPSKQAIGTLCVIDNKPRDFSKQEKRMLRILADRVIKLLELRRENLQKQKQLNVSLGELKLTLSRLLEAQETASIGSWDWNVKTGEFYWSPEMYSLFGISDHTKSITYEKWQGFIHPEDLPAVKKAITEGLKNQTPGIVEYRVQRPDNTQIWVLGKGATTVDSNGQVTRINGTAQDISKQKQAETDRLMYRKTLEEMLFALSHKIRRPVATCIGLINSLETTDLTDEKMRQYAGYFKTSADELDGFVREMTDFIHENKVKITGPNTGQAQWRVKR